MTTTGIAISLLLLPLALIAQTPCARVAFDTPQAFDLPPYSTTMQAADFDGDGRLDVGAQSPDAVFSIELGRGAGRFAPVIAVHDAFVVGVADITGDALPDLIVWGTTLGVRENLGGGSFGATIPFGVSGYTTFADFTNDGKTDVLITTAGSAFFIVKGGPNPVAVPTTAFTTDFVVPPVAGDFDGDGNIDLATPAKTRPLLRIQYGDGTGAFPRAATVDTDYGVNHVSVADVDGDGRDDILLSANKTHVQIVFAGGAAGVVHNDTVSSVGLSGPALLLTDLNGDGLADVIASRMHMDGKTEINVYVNDGHADFTLTQTLPDFTRPEAIADLDGDGKPDMLRATAYGFAVMHGNGDGTFELHRPEIGNGRIKAKGDVDGDGLDELVVRSENGDLVIIAPGAAPEPLHTYMEPGDEVSIAANGEILVRSHSQLDVFRRRADGTWTLRRSAMETSDAALLVDVDRDGVNELLVVLDARAKVFDDGSHLGVFAFDLKQDQSAYYLAAGDVNEDGRQDVIVSMSGTWHGPMHPYVDPTGDLVVYLGMGSGRFDSGHTLLTNNSFGPPHLADFNGDGHLDIALIQQDATFLVLAGDGSGAFSDQSPAQTVGTSMAMDVSDVNGDGIDDIGIWLDDTLTLYIGTPRGVVQQRERWWMTTRALSGLGLARFRADAPASAYISIGLEADAPIIVFDGVCETPRARGVRH